MTQLSTTDALGTLEAVRIQLTDTACAGCEGVWFQLGVSYDYRGTVSVQCCGCGDNLTAPDPEEGE